MNRKTSTIAEHFVKDLLLYDNQECFHLPKCGLLEKVPASAPTSEVSLSTLYIMGEAKQDVREATAS